MNRRIVRHAVSTAFANHMSGVYRVGSECSNSSLTRVIIRCLLYIRCSADEPEQRIAVITKQDPLPLTLSQNIQLIFNKLAKAKNVSPNTFFTSINHAECNKKLVSVRCNIFWIFCVDLSCVCVFANWHFN